MASDPGLYARGGSTGARRSSVLRVIAYALLLAEVLVILIPSVYGRATPKLLGIPFFYWFQLAWIIVAMVVTGIAYLLVERADARGGRSAGGERGGAR
jgi:Protein of unknown function (DUF3311)